uniref:Uncharacterized protein n=1 Tax=Arundo donax TaxID=35708 RepID=A0A0A9D837_ARUDO
MINIESYYIFHYYTVFFQPLKTEYLLSLNFYKTRNSKLLSEHEKSCLHMKTSVGIDHLSLFQIFQENLESLHSLTSLTIRINKKIIELPRVTFPLAGRKNKERLHFTVGVQDNKPVDEGVPITKNCLEKPEDVPIRMC